MSRVLGSATAVTAEDPFGPGDPLEVARLVRRALAAAGAKALDVTALVLVTDGPVDPAALARFTRRALGPHGAALVPVAVLSRTDAHEARVAEGTEVAIGVRAGPAGAAAPAVHSVVVVVALGPGSRVTVACVGGARA